MIIRTLRTEGFRHLDSQPFVFSDRINIIVGKNGSGKTSLLEAIYFASRLRSFRSADTQKLVNFNSDLFRIFVTLESDQSQSQSQSQLKIAIEKNKHETLVKLNGEFIQKKTELVRLLPILFLGPDSQMILLDSPKFRRRFLDWGLYHHHPAFLMHWTLFERALKQRNSALKQNLYDKVIDSLDIVIVKHGEALSQIRAEFTQQIFAAMLPFLQNLIQEQGEWSIGFKKGYSDDLNTALKNSRVSDRMAGFTRVGPHRADFSLKFKNQNVAVALSRGQLKLATISMMLAQLKIHQDKMHQPAILLVDDITAELDRTHREKLINALVELNAQLFISVLEYNEFPELSDLPAHIGRHIFKLG